MRRNENPSKGKKMSFTTKETVSFVIPCYRSEQTVGGVVEEIRTTMDGLTGYDYEVILVNDSSPDQTMNTIRNLCDTYPFITGIDLAKNFGQHAALMAGMRQSRGDIVVCLDDDGQTPANEVGKLLDKLKEGFDVCYASYGKKQHSGFRNFGSKVNEQMTRVMLGKPKELYISSYFAAKRFVVNDMLRYIFRTLNSTETSLRTVSKILRKQKHTNRNTALCLMVFSVVLIKHETEICRLKATIDELKNAKGE